MAIDRSLLTGSTAMLVLKLLEGKDMYGYEMIEQLARQSQNVFSLKAGTLYPLLHDLEQKGMLRAYDGDSGGRPRKYYSLTNEGHRFLAGKEAEWDEFSSAVSRILKGGISLERA